MFSRIAVVNRGEAAMRVIHAVRDINAAATDGHVLETVALHTEEERTAMFVREADAGHDLGPAAGRPYLEHAVLERALRETGADAAWVGWGFVAEDPAFAELCERVGVSFIGPSAEAMRRLGDKIGAKLLAEEVGVPVAPWSRGPVDTLEEARAAAEAIGYPLMLKATAGGGGRGIRVVASAADLGGAWERTRDEAVRSFGSGVMFLEQLVTGARHVEVQVVADAHGTAWALGVRDCSLQRRNQKVLEESASPVLTGEQAEALRTSAERLALAVGYVGAGTVEFLYHPGKQRVAFLEVNTRLQVEHPVTEETTGTDLVRLQIHLAAGGRLAGERPAEVGHSVEARLNAEDPDRDFAPAPGRIALLDLPSGPGVRVDTGVAEGDAIPADFDSMIAKVIAKGATREEALARLRRAMRETTVVIEGGATNKSFVLDLLDQPEVTTGSADTGWIDRVRAEGRLASRSHSGLALVAAGIEAYEEAEAIERVRLIETARGGRPHVRHRVGAPVELTLRGAAYRVMVLRTGPHRFRIDVHGPAEEATVDADLERLGRARSRLTVGGRTHRLVTAAHGTVQLVEVDGVAHRVGRDEGGVLRSPAPALVVATPAAAGSRVDAGAPLVVLESMKMETVLAAPFSARVTELLVATGGQVETGAPLIRLEPVEDDVPGADPGDPVDLDLPHPAGDTRGLREGAGDPQRLRADLCAMLLGYDLDPRDDGGTLERYLTHRDARDDRGDRAAAGPVPLYDEIRMLEVFADFAELSRNRPAGAEEHVGHRAHSPREHFHTYLQSLDVDRADLPDAFQAKLARVLRHYGVTDLERSPDLERAVLRIFLAQQRSEPEVSLATALLQRWIGEPAPAAPLDVFAHDVLDRLVVATQLRFPVVGDLARSVRFRWFEQALVQPWPAEVLDGIPQSEAVLAVLARQHYGEHDLSALREVDVDGRPFALADYLVDGRRTRLVSTVGEVGELGPGSRFADSLAAQVAGRPAGWDAAVDLYLRWPDGPPPVQDASAALCSLLSGMPFARDVRRVAVGVVAGGDVEVGYFTFRTTVGAGLAEDLPLRGVHPMVGRRLGLWRLRDFVLTRLEAPADVLLLHCVAADNPADQRLVALGQVRQLAVVRDEDGRVSGLPHAERAVADCVEAIRRARSALGGAGPRLDLNHVWLHIWPTIEADLDQLTALQEQIAPLTVGAGIEEVLVQGRVAARDGSGTPLAVRFSYQPGSGVVSSVEPPPSTLLAPLDDYAAKVLRTRRRGMVYPYELVSMVAGPGGTVTEYDLDDTGALVPVDRPYGLNEAGVICGVVTTPTPLHPDGVTRVLLCGDPLRALGAVSGAECARVVAALDLAERMQVPVEWFALSAGARIAMDSGTENMDAVAGALKRIVEFTQDGGEVNVVVAGVNVGAQPYWNAEATMLMHTKGVLVMTPESAMVLTGKQSLDFSGGVSAEDNFGIGGYDRVMGPNGQAQYWAPDLAGAASVLLDHYDHSYVHPGETRPRRVRTADPADRDVTAYPHPTGDSGFSTVGDVFSARANPERKKPFDIRTVMRAVADQDLPVVERWAGMADAQTAVVTDAHLGGVPVCLVGIESRSLPRRGFPPTDGPEAYTAGTLFPRSSKKVARALNAASGNRPVVVLANLSGFDGSPESMRRLQLEYGAEIGRAVVNFAGRIVFVVVSRYHGGAFVVFSKALNPGMTVLAVEGSYASVIGGAPAAAVVFAREVDARTAADPRIDGLQRRLVHAEADADDAEAARLATELARAREAVRAEVLRSVASEFDRVHDIHRAVAVGSVDAVVPAARLRPRVIDALDGGAAAGTVVTS